MRWRVLLLAAGVCAGWTPPVCAAAAPAAKTLAQCIAIAVANQPSLKAAAASAQAGSARVWEAGSGYLPTLGGTYTATRSRTNLGARTGGAATAAALTTNFYTAAVNFQQLLFDFGRTLNAVRSAQAAERSLQADESTQRATVVLNVKQAYFNVLATRRLLAVADETVRQNAKHLEQAQGRYDVGLAAKFDVTQARVQVANAQLNRVTARNNVLIARETLRNALGLTAPLDFDIVDTLDIHKVQVTQSAALAAAYARRPELQSIHAQELATSEQVTALQKAYLPNLSGNGGYSWTGSDYPLQPNWSVSADVSLSLNLGLTNAQIEEQKANLANLRFNEEVLRQNIALEVRQDVLNLTQADESIGVSETALEDARENLALAEGRYTTGVGDIIALTDAQASLTTAEANHVQALYTYKTAVAALEKATAQSLASE
jgi:outer membrane protein